MRRLSSCGLVFKQSFWVMMSVFIIVGSLILIMRAKAVSLLTESLQERAMQTGEATVQRLDQTFQESARIGEMLALRLGDGPLSEEQLASVMRETLRSVHDARPEILAIAVAYEPGAFGQKSERMRLAELASSRGEAIRMLDGFNYRAKNWYQAARGDGRGRWCEPFIGDFVKEPIAIYSAPFYEKMPDGGRRFAGVVCVDISLAWLREVTGRLRIADSGYAFILAASGRVVTHPDPEKVFFESIFSVADREKEPVLRTIGERMVRGERGFSPYLHLKTGRPAWICFMPLRSNGWSLGIIFPEAELFGMVDELGRSMLLWAAGGFALLLLVVVLISIRVSRPLTELTRAARQIGDGHFEIELPKAASGDELGALAMAFQQMRDSLIAHIENLKAVTSAKEKIESELKVAQDIQKGILPEILPPFPKCDYFEIDAFLHPAREVGGDLYDFFVLGEGDKVCLVVGDVSGKGVPASLFMAVTQTLHRGLAHESALDPARVVSQMNDALCRHNEAMMFVTYVLAVLDLKTGVMTYCNAGHNPFFIMSADGSVRMNQGASGVPLGVMDGLEFTNESLTLQVGDTVFFYTDGVTEAMDAEGGFYGEERLQALLAAENLRHVSPQVLNQTLLQAVRDFAGDSEQSDDITVLSLKITARA